MKKTLFFLVFSFYFLLSPALAQETQQQRLERHVYTLAADSLNGRQAGTADAVRAREYVARQWRDMGLKPLWGDSFEVSFKIAGAQGFCNLVAFIEGNDPALKEEYIVIGGHYDHLGNKNGEVYNGADDNASGTACVTEVARQLLARQKELKRSVIVCAFDAEEMGLYGSDALVRRMENEGIIGKVKLMLSVDMVGWLKAGGALTLQGTGTLADAEELTNPQTLGSDIRIHRKGFENSIFTATDTEPFAKHGIATLAVTTGLKSPYHKPGDDPELIDYEGLDKVTDYLTAFVLHASQLPGDLASGKVAAKHRQSQKKFEVGLLAGTNTGHIFLPDAAIATKSLPGWTGGMMMQYNFNNTWALHAGVLYSYTRNRMPLAEDAFGTGYRLRQESIAVPLTVQAGVYAPGVSMFLRVGGYFNYLLYGGTYVDSGAEPATMPAFKAPSPFRGGLTWGWGFRFGSVTFEVDSYYQLGNLFDTSAALPQANGSNVTVTLGYFF